jgi:hypothetical protein
MGHELLISQSDSDGSNIIQEGKNRASLTFSANNVSSLVSLTDDKDRSCSTAEARVQNETSATDSIKVTTPPTQRPWVLDLCS